MNAFSASEQRLRLNDDHVEAWEDGFRTGGEIGTFEWWYFDSQLDNGAKLVFSFFAKEMLELESPLNPSADIELTLADGRYISKEVRVPASEFRCSTERCDVNIGACYFRGDLQHYEIYFACDDVECKVTLDSLVKPWRCGSGYVGEDDYMAWLPAVPCGKVHVDISFGDEHFSVGGDGYHDHNWGNRPMPLLVNHWYWSRGVVGDYIVLTSYSVLAKEHNYISYPTFYLAQRGEVLADKLEFCRVETEDYQLDEVTGTPVPTIQRYIFDDGVKKFVLTYRKGDKLMDVRLIDTMHGDLRQIAEAAGFNGSYLRFTGVATVERHENGQLVDSQTGDNIWEIMYFGEVPPPEAGVL